MLLEESTFSCSQSRDCGSLDVSSAFNPQEDLQSGDEVLGFPWAKAYPMCVYLLAVVLVVSQP